MKPPSKKGSQTASRKKQSRPVQKKPAAANNLSQLEHRVETLERQLAEAQSREEATGEILGIIASSPTDIQPVLNVVVERAARLCDSIDAQLRLAHEGSLRLAASYGPLPPPPHVTIPINRQTVSGRVVADRQVIHVHDLELERETEYTEAPNDGSRSILGMPLLRQGTPIGSILIRRLEVRPFTDKQIALLKTFADQAVIAIENVRLFQEREAGNRDLLALHDVTAAASRSLEIQPVLDEVVRKIAEIFHFDRVFIFIYDPKAEALNLMALHGMPENISARAFRRGQGITGRVAETGQYMIFEDTRTDPRYRELSQTHTQQRTGACFFALFPIKAKEKFLGTINCVGMEPRKLMPEEIRLITSMADQISVAVENIHLFEQVRSQSAELESTNAELREALEHQTATAEVLSIISRSPTDVQPVLDAIVESAACVCGIDDVVLRLHEGNVTIPRAHFGPIPIHRVEISIDEPRFRWMREHGTLHVPDVRDRNELQLGRTGRWRTLLAVPLRQQGEFIGSLNARRIEVRAFTTAQIKLLETFADQAVIAIENVRLFKEIQERNAELREALEHQTATSEVLSIISRSPTDVQPVLDAIVESAARVCGIDDVVLDLTRGTLWFRGHILVPYPLAVPRSVLMSHTFAGCASMARCTSRMSARRTISRRWVAAASGAPS